MGQYYKSGFPLDLLLGIEYRSTPQFDNCCICVSRRDRNFVVVEQVYIEKDIPANRLLFLMFKRNLTTDKALSIIASRYGIPKYCIKSLGLKDAESSSLQYVYVELGTKRCRKIVQNLEKTSSADTCMLSVNPPLIVRPIGKIGKASLRRNVFTIIAQVNSHNYGVDPCKNSLLKRIEEINRKPLLNYYGYQRFGAKRPSNHIAAYFFVRGNYGLFFKEYIDSPYPDESIDNIEARISMRKNIKLGEKALLKMPRGFAYEAAITRCLKTFQMKKCATIAMRMQCIVISSLQSWLFNKYLSLRVKDYKSIETPIPGERKNQETVYAPVPGPGLRLEKTARSLYEYISESHGIDLESLSRTKACSIKGFWRPLWVKTRIEVRQISDKAIMLKFGLPKASYATNVLRELACSPACIS